MGRLQFSVKSVCSRSLHFSMESALPGARNAYQSHTNLMRLHTKLRCALMKRHWRKQLLNGNMVWLNNWFCSDHMEGFWIIHEGSASLHLSPSQALSGYSLHTDGVSLKKFTMIIVWQHLGKFSEFLLKLDENKEKVKVFNTNLRHINFY